MAERLGSVVFYGNGKGSFSIVDLPEKMQLSPIFSFQKISDSTSSQQVYAAGGNFFDVIPYEGQYDAQSIAFFSAGDTLQYLSTGPYETFKMQARNLKWLRTAGNGKLLAVACNNEGILFFKPGVSKN